eukprot:gene6712-13605_t
MSNLQRHNSSTLGYIQLEEFSDACLDVNQHKCLGHIRRTAEQNCQKSNVFAKTLEHNEPIFSKSSRLVYWNEQIVHQTKSNKGIIDGYFYPSDAMLISVILHFQLSNGIVGNIGEIGVHHGKSFIWMMLHMRNNEQAVAIDLFQNQKENIDHSGKGDMFVFMNNIVRYTNMTGTVIVPINSLRIPLCFFHKRGLQGFRIFSVDGGHHSDHAYEDTWTAFSVLAKGGVIAIDDVFHGTRVMEGILRFLYTNPNAKPFLFVQSKLFICQKEYYSQYFEAIKAWMNEKPKSFTGRQGQGTMPLAGSIVIVLPPSTPYTLHGWFLSPVLSSRKEVYSCDHLKDENQYIPFHERLNIN